MRGPPGEPSTIATLPSFITIVGAIEDSGRLPGAMALAVALHQPEPVGHAGFDGEVVHLVVQQEAGVSG